MTSKLQSPSAHLLVTKTVPLAQLVPPLVLVSPRLPVLSTVPERLTVPIPLLPAVVLAVPLVELENPRLTQ